jgi:hypothetical protein
MPPPVSLERLLSSRIARHVLGDQLRVSAPPTGLVAMCDPTLTFALGGDFLRHSFTCRACAGTFALCVAFPNGSRATLEGGPELDTAPPPPPPPPPPPGDALDLDKPDRDAATADGGHLPEETPGERQARRATKRTQRRDTFPLAKRVCSIAAATIQNSPAALARCISGVAELPPATWPL